MMITANRSFNSRPTTGLVPRGLDDADRESLRARRRPTRKPTTTAPETVEQMLNIMWAREYTGASSSGNRADRPPFPTESDHPADPNTGEPVDSGMQRPPHGEPDAR